jgi:hypothetical protein
MARKIVACLVWIAAVLITLTSCSRSTAVAPPPGGSGTETTAAITMADSLRVRLDGVSQNVKIQVFASSYSPHSRLGYADSAIGTCPGAVALKLPDTGVYSIYIVEMDSGRSLFVDTLPPSGSADTVLDTLKTPGGFSGTVVGDSAAAGPRPFYYVFIQGSPFLSLTDTAGAFSLDRVPAGTYWLSVEETIKAYRTVRDFKQQVSVFSSVNADGLLLILPK